MAEQLAGLGLDTDFPGLKADVNVRGEGLVSLGAIRPEAAELLAELTTVGLSVKMAADAKSADTPAA
ncbi:hypothetical protein [Streptomyces melanogenes]|uniref:hypothetical protein n=1 Tax=Streptomyces melanogenes TaxID=67326 RepID=UPI0037B9F4EF